jgi:hypothetical protein
MLERGVTLNIGLICIEASFIYIYIYECPYAILRKEDAQGLAVRPTGVAVSEKH